jgi:alcohol dehydrogenase class IV
VRRWSPERRRTNDLDFSSTGSGMDALTQLIEPFLSRRVTPVTDALAREGLRRSATALRPACRHGLADDDSARWREDLALASLLGGMCLANAGLGIVHRMASVIGGRYHAPHGAVCAALLPSATAVNLEALRNRAPGHPSLPKAEELGPLLTGDPSSDSEDAISWLRDLRRDLAIPGLASYFHRPAEVEALFETVRAASSSKANPIELTKEEISQILDGSLRGAVGFSYTGRSRSQTDRTSWVVSSRIASATGIWRVVR